MFTRDLSVQLSPFLSSSNGTLFLEFLGSTLKNSFIIIHYSRFKQTVGLYTLQAPSQNLKVGDFITSLISLLGQTHPSLSRVNSSVI